MMPETRKLESLDDLLSLISDHEGDLESDEVIRSIGSLMYSHDTKIAQSAALCLVSSCGREGVREARRLLAVKDPVHRKDVRGVLDLAGHRFGRTTRFKVAHGGSGPVPGSEEAREQYCTCPGQIGEGEMEMGGYTVDRTCIHHGD